MTEDAGAASPEDIVVRRKRLKFRSDHRGTKEMDLLIGGFVAANVDRYGPAELDALEVLLERPDPELYAWIIGQEEPAAELAGQVLSDFLAFRPSGHPGG